MASSLIKLSASPLHLTPGQSVTTHWNNATPPLAVWYIQAIPLESSFGGLPGVQSVEVEVTRVWRRLNQTPQNSDVEPNKYEHEIWYVIKNLSTKEVNVDVYASLIS
jgi:predicted alpha/beta hydrolase